MSIEAILDQAHFDLSDVVNVVSLHPSQARDGVLNYRELAHWLNDQIKQGKLTPMVRLQMEPGNHVDYAFFGEHLFCLFLRGTHLRQVRFVAEGYTVFRLLTDGGLTQRRGADSTELGRFDCSILRPGDAATGWSSSSREGVGVTGVVLFCGTEFLKEKLASEPDSTLTLSSLLPVEADVGYSRADVHCTQDMIGLGYELLGLDLSSKFALIRCEGLVLQALSEFLRTVAGNHTANSTMTQISARDVQRLNEAREYILENYRENLTVKSLARQVGLNRTKLNDGFRELFGTSVHGFVIEQRMLAVRQLLQQNASLDSIAQQVGYGSPASLSRAFKKYFGASPGEFRRAAR